MTIRKSSDIFYLITGALVLLLVMCVTLQFFEQPELRLAQQARHSSFLAADELRLSSDDLTRMARTHVITADPKFERMYWQTFAIRGDELARPRHYERSYWDLAIVDSDFRSEHTYPDTRQLKVSWCGSIKGRGCRLSLMGADGAAAELHGY